MKRFIIAVVSASLFASISYSATCEDLRRSPLTSVGAVTSLGASPDLDDPGAGGGFDSEAYFRNRFLPKLSDCTEKITNVYKAWAIAHGFQIPLRETGPGKVLIHATRADLNGLFELTYRVHPNRERARVTVYFYSRDGARHEPTAVVTMLRTYGIAELQDDLDTALACGNT